MKITIKFLTQFISFLIFSLTAIASSNIEGLKQDYKYNHIKSAEEIPAGMKKGIIGISDRLEADALLELADETYYMYSDYKTPVRKKLIKSEEILLIMPRIDLLEAHIKSLALTTDTVFLFIMEGDQLENEYGDRSYETFIEKGLEEKMPNNVKVFKLTNASVTETGDKNNFEFSNIQNSRVFREQIIPMYYGEKNKK